MESNNIQEKKALVKLSSKGEQDKRKKMMITMIESKMFDAIIVAKEDTMHEIPDLSKKKATGNI